MKAQYTREGASPHRGSALLAMLKIAGAQWGLMTVALMALLVASAASLFYPQYIRAVVDGSLNATPASELTRTCIEMLALSALLGLAVAARQIAFGLAGENIAQRLREKAYGCLLRQDIAFFDRNPTSTLLSRLTVDVSAIRGALSFQASVLVRCTLQVVGGLGFLIYTSRLLGFVTIGTLFSLIFLTSFTARRVRRLVSEADRGSELAAGLAHESLSGIRTVRTCAAGDHEFSRYASALRVALLVARRAMLLREGLRGVVSFSTYATSVLMLWLGSRLISNHELSVGDLTSCFAYSVILATAFTNATEAGNAMVPALVAAERLIEVLRPPRTVSGRLIPKEVHGAIGFSAVQFGYEGGAQAITLDALDIPAGQSVALVGPSGAGKSTFAALVAHLYDPQTGHVLLDGHDVRTLDDTWFREQVAVVPQEPLIFTGTIAENIRYGRPASPLAVEAAARDAGAHEFISSLPLGYDTQTSGCLLSGGERQRISIARALLRRPRVLILDEATGALDGENEHLVRCVVERMVGKLTVLIVSHRLAAIAGVERILVMQRGRVTHDGSHHELLQTCDTYRRLVERATLMIHPHNAVTKGRPLAG